MSEKISELLSLTQRAEKMEYVNEESALRLYVEIFERFEPKISKTYDSAIRLLEKRDRLREALAIADRAIAQIKAAEMSSSIEKYQEVRARIERKLLEQGTSPSASETKPTNWKAVAAILGFVVLLLLILIFATPYGRILVNLDGKSGLENGEQIFSESEKPQYPITQKMIDFATKNILRDPDVVNAIITVQDHTAGVGLITTVQGKNRAHELVCEYLRYLAKAASSEYKELNPPGGEGEGDRLGDLYNHYDLVITAATGTTSESIYLKGTMNKGGSSIYYRD